MKSLLAFYQNVPWYVYGSIILMFNIWPCFIKILVYLCFSCENVDSWDSIKLLIIRIVVIATSAVIIAFYC